MGPYKLYGSIWVYMVIIWLYRTTYDWNCTPMHTFVGILKQWHHVVSIFAYILLLWQVLVRGHIFLNTSLTEAFCIAIVTLLDRCTGLVEIVTMKKTAPSYDLFCTPKSVFTWRRLTEIITWSRGIGILIHSHNVPQDGSLPFFVFSGAWWLGFPALKLEHLLHTYIYIYIHVYTYLHILWKTTVMQACHASLLEWWK